MPRRRARPDSERPSRAPKAPAAPEGFTAWKSAVQARLKGIRGVDRIPERVWTNWYVRGLSIEAGVDEAQREANNRLTAAERKFNGMEAS